MRKRECSGLPNPSRRLMLMTGMAGVLSACGDSPMGNMLVTLTNTVTPRKEIIYRKEDLDRIPYASILAKVGDGPLSVLVLGSVEGSDFHWFSNDRAVIVTRNGRVIRSAGFPIDLKFSRYLDVDPLSRPPGTEAGAIFRRVVDMEPARVFGEVLVSKFDVVGEETLDLMFGRFHTVHVVETGSATNMKWAFENHFWRDLATGAVVSSLQSWVVDTPPVAIDLGRPFTA